MSDMTPEQWAKYERINSRQIEEDGDKAEFMGMSQDERLKLPWLLFVAYTRDLTPASYGSQVEKYLLAFYGWGKVGKSEDRGDAVDFQASEGGSYYEIKVSFVPTSTGKTQFDQIRLWQDLDAYSLFVVERDNSLVRFDLTKDDVIRELELQGWACHAHGTKSAMVDNDRTEKNLRLTGDMLGRWNSSYRNDCVPR